VDNNRMRQLGLAKQTAAWLASIDYGRVAPRPVPAWNHAPTGQPEATDRSGGRLVLLERPADWSPVLAQNECCQVIFDGVLHNRAELRAPFADRLPRDPNDAELVGQAYRCWGEGALVRLLGAFALIVWDHERGEILCARDQAGIHPLFYAEAGHSLLVSPSIDTLVKHSAVSSSLNRIVLAEHLLGRWHNADETYFAHVNRLPPGHALYIGQTGRRVYRYWSPFPGRGAVDWVPNEEAQERFERLFERAVVRRLAPGRPGILLSGGHDSVAIATIVAEVCRRHGGDAPLALSLAYDLDSDEARLQRAVASALSLPQVQLRLDDAAGPNGLFATVLEMAETLPAPLRYYPNAAISQLSLAGGQQGCRVILAGDGGDEWAGVAPYHVADLLRTLHLPAVYRLWLAYHQAYPGVRWAEGRVLLWEYGVHPIARDVGSRAATRVGLRGALQRRDTRLARRVLARHPWLAPDSSMREQMIRRLTEASAALPTASVDRYSREDIRARLDDPQICLLMEEAFVRGRRSGAPEQHPFWDRELIELLVRIRPEVRQRGGRSKALVRDVIARRLPELGFDSRPRINPTNSFWALLTEQARSARELIGRPWALAGLGVVDAAEIDALIADPVAVAGPSGWGRLLEVLNLEVWVRAHQ
jgi:asparagine synthase (glutamine-hydrolysing)